MLLFKPFSACASLTFSISSNNFFILFLNYIFYLLFWILIVLMNLPFILLTDSHFSRDLCFINYILCFAHYFRVVLTGNCHLKKFLCSVLISLNLVLPYLLFVSWNIYVSTLNSQNFSVSASSSKIFSLQSLWEKIECKGEDHVVYWKHCQRWSKMDYSV